MKQKTHWQSLATIPLKSRWFQYLQLPRVGLALGTLAKPRPEGLDLQLQPLMRACHHALCIGMSARGRWKRGQTHMVGCPLLGRQLVEGREVAFYWRLDDGFPVEAVADMDLAALVQGMKRPKVLPCPFLQGHRSPRLSNRKSHQSSLYETVVGRHASERPIMALQPQKNAAMKP